MRIKLINPNTTQRMTDAMGRCAREVAALGTEIVAVSPTMGPRSIKAITTRHSRRSGCSPKSRRAKSRASTAT